MCLFKMENVEGLLACVKLRNRDAGEDVSLPINANKNEQNRI